MRMSRLFLKTLREVKERDEGPGSTLARRAGVLHEVVSGHPTLLPLGVRARHRLLEFIRRGIEELGGQEIDVPAVVSREILERSGRWGRETGWEKKAVGRNEERGGERFLDTGGVETVLETARSLVQSYKDLPRLLYAVRTMVPWEGAPNAFGARETTCIQTFCLTDGEEEGRELNRAFRVLSAQLATWCGLGGSWMEAVWGVEGQGQGPQVALCVPHSKGSTSLLSCQGCRRHFLETWAPVKKPPYDGPAREGSSDRVKVATPAVKTITDLSRFLSVSPQDCLKAFFMEGPKGFVLGAVRGDLEVSVSKLSAASGVEPRSLEMATPEAAKAAGLVPGFASPIGVGPDVHVVVDDSVDLTRACVAGANEVDHHYTGVLPKRDFPEHLVVADIAGPGEEPRCPGCGEVYTRKQAWEVGRWSPPSQGGAAKMEASFTQDNSKPAPLTVSWGYLDTTALLGAVLETHHDDAGLLWPLTLSPFDVHLIRLGKPKDDLDQACLALQKELEGAGLRVLFDDRKESPGVKFNDADLLGFPVRLVMSAKNMKEDVVEMKLRSRESRERIPANDAVAKVLEALDRPDTTRSPRKQ